MLAVVGKSGPNLAAGVLIATELGFQGSFSEVVESNAGIVGSNQQFDIAVGVIVRDHHRVNPGNLVAFGIASTGRSNMDLPRYFQTFGVVNVKQPVQTPSH
jgi:hypothetical protein